MIGDIIILLVFAATIVFEILTKKKRVLENQVNTDPLSSNEKLITWILCIFNPILAGAILYYGWKKTMPNKAKEANSISMKAFLIGIILYAAIFFSTGRYQQEIGMSQVTSVPSQIQNRSDANLKYTSPEYNYTFEYPNTFVMVNLNNIAELLKNPEIKGETKKTIEEINTMDFGRLQQGDIVLIEKTDIDNYNIVSFGLSEERDTTLENELKTIRENVAKKTYQTDFEEKKVLVGTNKIDWVEFTFRQKMSRDEKEPLAKVHNTYFQYNGKVFIFYTMLPGDGSVDIGKYLGIYNKILSSLTFN